jgi:hypothetical protein
VDNTRNLIQIGKEEKTIIGGCENMGSNEDHDLLIKIATNTESILERLQPLEIAVTNLKINDAKQDGSIKTYGGEIEKLRSNSTWHNWINSVLVVMGSALGIFIKGS